MLMLGQESGRASLTIIREGLPRGDGFHPGIMVLPPTRPLTTGPFDFCIPGRDVRTVWSSSPQTVQQPDLDCDALVAPSGSSCRLRLWRPPRRPGSIDGQRPGADETIEDVAMRLLADRSLWPMPRRSSGHGFDVAELHTVLDDGRSVGKSSEGVSDRPLDGRRRLRSDRASPGEDAGNREGRYAAGDPPSSRSRLSNGRSTAWPVLAARKSASVISMYFSPSQNEGSVVFLPPRTASMKSASTLHSRASAAETSTGFRSASPALPARMVSEPWRYRIVPSEP